LIQSRLPRRQETLRGAQNDHIEGVFRGVIDGDLSRRNKARGDSLEIPRTIHAAYSGHIGAFLQEAFRHMR